MSTVPESFADLPLSGGATPPEAAADRAAWTSPEGIDILPVYGPEHLEGLDALDTWPGLSPCRCGTPRPIWLGSMPSSFREASLMVITCVQELWLLPRQ